MEIMKTAWGQVRRFCHWTTLNFWLAMICYALAAWLFICFLIVDASFIRPLAPASIEADTFQHVAWGYRFFGLFCIAMTVALFAMKRWLWGWITLGLAVVCSVILFGHAIGLSFKSMEEQYASGAVVTTLETVSVEEINVQIADIDKRRGEIRADRDSEVERLQSSIDAIANDGLNNDHEAQPFRANQEAAENAAKAALAALDTQRADLVAKRQEARTGAATQAVEKVSFNPFFVGLARFKTGQWQPGAQVDETASYTSGLGFFGIFFAFGELLMMLTPGLGSTFLILHYDKRKDWQANVTYSEDVPDGHVRWEGTPEEWDEIEKALQVHRNIKTGNKKGARTKRLGNKIEAESEYYRDRISMFMDEHNRGVSTDQIAKKHGMTVAVMRMSYGPYMNIEEQNALFGGSQVGSSETKEPQPTKEIEPDANKNYPVAPYDTEPKPNGLDQEERP